VPEPIPVFTMIVFTEGHVELTPHRQPKGDLNASTLDVLREVVASMERGDLVFYPPTVGHREVLRLGSDDREEP